MDQKNKNSKKPTYSKFSQQELPAWKPILTPGWAIASFITVGALFIPTGLLALSASDSVVEIIDRYDEDCVPDEYSNNPEAENDTRNCFPEAYSADNKPIVPCGLIAWSLFNDTRKNSKKAG